MRGAVVGRRGEALRELCGVKEDVQRHGEYSSRAMEIFEAYNVFFVHVDVADGIC